MPHARGGLLPIRSRDTDEAATQSNADVQQAAHAGLLREALPSYRGSRALECAWRSYHTPACDVHPALAASSVASAPSRRVPCHAAWRGGAACHRCGQHVHISHYRHHVRRMGGGAVQTP
jgi:hypothetical protein